MSEMTAMEFKINPDLKLGAEAILRVNGYTPEQAINELYRQIILHSRIPFDVKLPSLREPICAGNLSEEEVMVLVQKGLDDVKTGRVYTLEEIEAILNVRFGLRPDNKNSK